MTDPREELLSFCGGGLLHLLRGHLGEIDLLFHSVEQLQPGVTGQLRELVEIDIAFLGIAIVTVVAMILQDCVNCRGNLRSHVKLALPLGECAGKECEKSDKCCDLCFHGLPLCEI